MCRKIVVFILYVSIFLGFLGISFSTDISACGTLSGSSYYRLTQDLNVDGTCFTLSRNNMVLDLNGHTITGNGTGVGLNLHYNYNNVTIINGFVSNFNSGVYQYHLSNSINNVYNLENVVFTNNIYDININSYSTSRIFNFKDCIFNNDISFVSIHAVYFSGSTNINQSIENRFYGNGNYFYFNNTGDRVFGYLEFAGISAMNVLDDRGIFVRDLCNSTTNSGPFVLKLYEDNYCSGSAYSFAKNGMVIDLNGKTLYGSMGGGYGIRLHYNYNNVTVRNGIISNFTYGVYQSHLSNSYDYIYNVENVDFVDNDYDVYLASYSTSRIFNFKDSSFGNDIYFRSIHAANFTGNTVINQDVNERFYGTGNYFYFDTIGERVFGYLEFAGISGMNVLDGRGLEVRDLCNSILSSGPFVFKLYEDNVCSGTAYTFTKNNMVIDLNGHTITGDGAGAGISFPYNYNNITVRNGFISNFTYGVFQSHNSNGIQNSYFTNGINFLNNTYDVYFDSFQNSRLFYVYNSTITSDVYVRDVNVFELALNSIANGSLIDVADRNAFNTNVLVDGVNSVGNFWGDFVCDNSSNSRSFNSGGFEYVVCDENDYTNYSLSDVNPLFSFVYTPPVILGENGGSGFGSNTKVVSLPFSDFFGVLGSFVLVVLFGFFS